MRPVRERKHGHSKGMREGTGWGDESEVECKEPGEVGNHWRF